MSDKIELFSVPTTKLDFSNLKLGSFTGKDFDALLTKLISSEVVWVETLYPFYIRTVDEYNRDFLGSWEDEDDDADSITDS